MSRVDNEKFQLLFYEPSIIRKPPDNLRNYHYLDTMETTLLHFSTDECFGNQISNGE